MQLKTVYERFARLLPILKVQLFNHSYTECYTYWYNITRHWILCITVIYRAQHKFCEVYKCSRTISTIINVEDLSREENMSDLLLPSSSLLKGQMDDGAIVHVVIGQRVGIFDENTLENQTQYEISVFKVNTFIFNNVIKHSPFK